MFPGVVAFGTEFRPMTVFVSPFVLHLSKCFHIPNPNPNQIGIVSIPNDTRHGNTLENQAKSGYTRWLEQPGTMVNVSTAAINAVCLRSL